MLTLAVLALPLGEDAVERPLPRASPLVETTLGQLLETVPTGRADTISLFECMYDRYSFFKCVSEVLFRLGSQLEHPNDADSVAREAFAWGALVYDLRPTAIPSPQSEPSELLLETVEER